MAIAMGLVVHIALPHNAPAASGSLLAFDRLRRRAAARRLSRLLGLQPGGCLGGERAPQPRSHPQDCPADRRPWARYQSGRQKHQPAASICVAVTQAAGAAQNPLARSLRRLHCR